METNADPASEIGAEAGHVIHAVLLEAPVIF